MSIIGAEDEDFENDLNDAVDDLGSYFNSIEQLCYLHVDLIKNLSAKETKKQFVEFYNNFLDKGA
ncbi:hypothetical protein CRUP_004802, partial [Coryphaenoides rupestris]